VVEDGALRRPPAREEWAEKTRCNGWPRSLRRCTRRYTAQRAVFHHAMRVALIFP